MTGSNGFGDERGHAEGGGAGADGGRALAAQEDDGDLAGPRVAAERLHEAEAVEPRHPDVGEDDVGQRRACPVERAPAVLGLQDVEPRELQVERAEQADRRIVVDDQRHRTARRLDLDRGNHPDPRYEGADDRTSRGPAKPAPTL